MKAVERFLLNSFYVIYGMNFYFIGAVLFVFLGEAHTFWVNDNTQVDWYLLLDYKEYKQWAIRDVCNLTQMALLAGMLYHYVPKHNSLKKITLAIFLYTIGDAAFYFIDMKTHGYGVIYIILCVCVIFSSNIKSLFSRK